ncbi:glutamate ligase domain-containing protein [Buchnera aphidicola]|uniref:glutamate ligase domain-containing protein n=1 Tax=Buchnera aphidicola TaxID=9 RepID=UPI003464163F
MYTPSGKVNISLPCLGYQNISNALAATALAYSINIPLKEIQNGLSKTPTLSGRLESIKLSPNKILINDTYNSNVASMIAAIKILEKMPGYKILVVADMAELGKNSILYHRMIGNIANISKIDIIFSIGENSHEITKMSENGVHFLDKIKLNKKLKKIILKKETITVLIKGSRSTKMEKTVTYLIRECKKNDNID